MRSPTNQPPDSACRRSWLVGGLLLLGLATSACSHLPVESPQLSGTFRGESIAGQPWVVTFDEEELAFQGAGSEDGEPLVLAGPVVWFGVGTLTRADGSSELVELRLSADGERLELTETAGGPVNLERGAPSAAPVAGPFSGSYRAERGAATLARARLIQSGSLIAGSAAILGEPVGVSGRVTSNGRAAGFVQFPDGSQIAFEAELLSGGRRLRLEGFGRPLTLEREARP